MLDSILGDDELDAISYKLTGRTFDAQAGPMEKSRIMELALQFKSIEKLSNIDVTLCEIDANLSIIANWFANSRLWEGR